MDCPLWIQVNPCTGVGFWSIQKKFKFDLPRLDLTDSRVRKRLNGVVVKRCVLDLKFIGQKLLFYYLGLSLILNNGARERMQSCVKHYQARDGENQ